MAYDEVVKFLMTNATPPDPGSFQSDYDAAINSQKAPASEHHGMFGAIMNAADAVKNGVGMMRNGIVSRHYFLNGWERTEDPSAQTATITKPNLHQEIGLDLAKKTYRIVDTNAKPPTSTPSPYERPQQGTEQQSQPGGGKLEISATSSNLGPKTIDGVQTTGYSTTFKMTLSQATGSCKNGTFQVRQTAYVARFAEPHAGNQTAKAATPSIPRPESLVARGGCSPTVTMHSKLASNMPAGRFAVYSVSLIEGNAGPQAPGGGIGTVIERGNVHSLTASDAGLFGIPAGFTQAG